METLLHYLIKQRIIGSYRTYEEWKPPRHYPSPFQMYRSYRTYEEWKLSIDNGV